MCRPIKLHNSGVGGIRVSSEDLSRANAGNSSNSHVEVATAALVHYNLTVTFEMRMCEFSGDKGSCKITVNIHTCKRVPLISCFNNYKLERSLMQRLERDGNSACNANVTVVQRARFCGRWQVPIQS